MHNSMLAGRMMHGMWLLGDDDAVAAAAVRGGRGHSTWPGGVTHMPAPAPAIHEGVPPRSQRQSAPQPGCRQSAAERPPTLDRCSGAAPADAAGGCSDSDWASFVQAEQRASIDPTLLYHHTVRYH